MTREEALHLLDHTLSIDPTEQERAEGNRLLHNAI